MTTSLALTQSVARRYYLLVKPGIIYGNLLSVIGGYLLGAQGGLSLGSFAGVLVGTASIIACGCIINNYTDRAIDAKMSRTKERALVVGTIEPQAALVFAVALGLFGFTALGALTNPPTVLVGAAGLLFYILMYAVAKRRSPLGTLVGSVSGATPPVAGYVAATGQFDIAAGLLFLSLVTWQMPHFYAIAIYRRKDYASAGLPVLSVAKGIDASKREIVVYMCAFLGIITALTLTGVTGLVFGAVLGLLTLRWIALGLAGFRVSDNERWARRVFGQSLAILLTFSVLLSVEIFLP